MNGVKLFEVLVLEEISVEISVEIVFPAEKHSRLSCNQTIIMNWLSARLSLLHILLLVLPHFQGTKSIQRHRLILVLYVLANRDYHSPELSEADDEGIRAINVYDYS
ncbi:hypothetical protein RIR_jg3460.t1 [Rhizophagus irregularis DAOM 181602=DAOM 197198]|nr:hypothetical protein RIR_jg3460.t1 [Rhizophagus irregularis DAOM 181602=DAOM 197198]